MKISVIVPGRLHGFDMALYFQKLGFLNQLVTGYPSKYVVSFGFQKKNIKSLYINELINRGTNFLGLGYPLDFLACEAFDFLASKTIKFDSNFYFIWSGYGLKTIKILRKKNPTAKIIIVRGSAHIVKQEELLQIIIKSDKQQINRKIIQKELLEYEAADYITVPSTFALNTFLEKGICIDKLFLNFLGVDLSQFPFHKKSIALDTITIGNIGTLNARKNIVGLINVIATLNLMSPTRYQLLLAGPIDAHSFDKKILAKYDFITYFGKLSQDELYQIYSKMDVFVMNSIEDGFGMVLLQAMSCGCPVIATINTAGPDLIKDYENGIIIPILDDEALKNSLIWMYENKSKIPQMSLRSRAITEKGFTWDDFGERNIKFLENIKSNQF